MYNLRIMKTNDIRTAYLAYFANKTHAVIDSASLLPENDPTTLFTGSGMQPMVPYLLGQSHPQGTRITDSQKCFRGSDIDEVGDNRHTTFFEMLGNWSLGDYFKAQQIEWAFDFLMNDIGLDPSKLYITCFSGNEEIGIPKDTEAAEKWQKLFKEKGIDASIADNPEEKGMQGARIFYYNEKKNWWSRAGVPQNMPVGEPGGPDAEMFWDFGDGDGIHAASVWKDTPCHVNCDCGRFMEIGNNVFMAYRKTEDGFVELEKKNIDFGGGLERIAAAAINNPDIFMIDQFDGVRNHIEQVSGKTYGANEKETYAFRVVMDHVRAAAFLIGDNAVPSNKDQGYFTRRLLRRAVRFAQDLGVTEAFVGTVVGSVIDAYTDAYPDLAAQKDHVMKVASAEEEKFRKTLQQGLKKFEEMIADGALTTEDAFDLYQSYGFPIEITEELAREKGIVVDMEAFAALVKKHKDLSREASQKKFKGGMADTSEMSVKYHTATHLLHIALKKVLGDHVEQKGSNITPDRLRFDFSHPEKMTPEQKAEVEVLVNAAIAKDYPIDFQEMPLKEALDNGVIGLFTDKYDDVVKVYTIGDPAHAGNANPEEPTFSREICGGPHVTRTGDMGTFKIKKEEASSAGIRRIKAILL